MAVQNTSTSGKRTSRAISCEVKIRERDFVIEFVDRLLCFKIILEQEKYRLSRLRDACPGHCCHYFDHSGCFVLVVAVVPPVIGRWFWTVGPVGYKHLDRGGCWCPSSVPSHMVILVPAAGASLIGPARQETAAYSYLTFC